MIRPLVLLWMLAALAGGATATTLGIDGARFTLNGKPTFLLGISYYGGLGARPEFVRRDLDDLKRNGLNWLRVWATWSFGDLDVSAVDGTGQPRDPYMERLKQLVAECDRRGMIVDVTLSRGRSAIGGGIPDFAAHRAAVESVISALANRRNWYLDLANERDVRDARYVSTEELATMRARAREMAPWLIVTASFGGHDLDERYVRQALVDARLDFVAPHRPRDAASPGQTEEQTLACLKAMERLGRVAPVHYQEPFRRGYGNWQPRSADFLLDLRQAVAGGAAGWCLHNGSVRDSADDKPWRSFDLRAQRLMDQLDAEELTVVREASAVVRKAAAERPIG